MGKSWTLNPKEVYSYGGSSTSLLRKNSRQPRIIDQRSVEINIVHIPTKIEVGGSVPKGNYSKKELGKLKDFLYKSLFIELENKVAKYLKISKR